MTSRSPGRVLVVQPEAEDPPGLLGEWLAAAGCRLDVRHPYAGDPLTLDGSAGLVVLGGAMSANDDAVLDWIPTVKQLLRDAADGGVPTLGVCLGHQLIGAALGGVVGPNPLGPQVGLYAVGWTPEADDDPLLGPLATPRRGVQWNDDLVLTPPPGAVVLARTDRGEVQAVRYADTVWGVQLHPEVDAATVALWASEAERDRLGALGVDADRMLADIHDARAELDAAWRPLADRFAVLVHDSSASARSGNQVRPQTNRDLRRSS